jgi:CheY-like chemotaxis protein
MPELDGFSVAEHIKAMPRMAGATIIMLTSDHHPGDIVRCRELGIVCYLVKPIKKAELWEAIRVALSKTSDAAPEEPPAQAGEDVARCAPPLCILLVEDAEENRLLIQAYLKNTNYRIEVAVNGQMAVEKFTADRYDLVLMDMQMPVMDGYAATRAIRKWEADNKAAPTPIIALTAYALKEEEQKSMDAGCDAHLTKPIKKAKLLETLANFTKGQSHDNVKQAASV